LERLLDLKVIEERPEGLVHGPPQAMSVPHLQLTFAVQTIAVSPKIYTRKKKLQAVTYPRLPPFFYSAANKLEYCDKGRALHFSQLN
jgi:hypothetical protein